MIPITRPDLPPLAEFTALLERIWATRMLSNFGEFSQQLERIASDYLGVGVRSIASGDLGLVAAISSLDLAPGSHCLVPSFTFNSTVNALLWNDLVPVFVDIDPRTLNVDPAHAAELARRTEPSLILATHVFGNPADAEGLGRVAAEHGAVLMFDAAHGYGARRDGVPAGALGDVEVFSLSGTKLVTSAEGGLVAARDPELLSRLEYVRAYGFQGDYHSRYRGLNGKLSELHAALGVLTLPRIEDVLARRTALVDRYRERLDGVEGVVFQHVRPQDRCAYKDLGVLFDDRATRDATSAALAAEGVQTKTYFRPCHRMDAFKAWALHGLPNTDSVADRVLCLPLFTGLEDAAIERICATVTRAAARAPAVR